MPPIGARTSVSSSRMRAFSSATSARTTSERALAKSSTACSCSCSVSALDSNSASERFFWAVALASLALATSRSASAWAKLFLAVRGSTWISRSPRLTVLPVSTLSLRISPEALDFTSTVVSGWMVPLARAETTMSRRSTATAW